MNSTQNIFNKITNADTAIRVDENINHNIFLGKDEKNRLIIFAVSSMEPFNIASSNLIEVQTGMRSDGQWVLSFILINQEYSDMFCHFCDDMIMYAVDNKNKDVIESFSNRYIKWQNMLKKNNSGLLSKEAVKGLIGEIHFLLNYMIHKYGAENAIYSWVGIEYNIHDFITDHLWYEVKSVKNGASTVTVSSIEQLDSDENGQLVINYFDDTSITDSNKITLNSIVHELLNININENIKIMIYDKLIDYGYVNRKEYDTIAFRFVKRKIYNINNTTEIIRRNNIPDTIKNARYEIFIAKIQDYKEDGNGN